MDKHKRRKYVLARKCEAPYMQIGQNRCVWTNNVEVVCQQCH